MVENHRSAKPKCLFDSIQHRVQKGINSLIPGIEFIFNMAINPFELHRTSLVVKYPLTMFLRVILIWIVKSSWASRMPNKSYQYSPHLRQCALVI